MIFKKNVLSKSLLIALCFAAFSIAVPQEVFAQNARTLQNRMNQIQSGMTTSQVQSIMRGGPDSRSMDENTERWTYISNGWTSWYRVIVTFTDGRVTRVIGEYF